VLRNLSLKAVSLGLERGVRFVVTVVAAPLIGEVAFGRYVFASTVTALLALAAELGLGVWTTRALARPGSDAAVVVRTGFALRALSAVPYAVAVAAVAFSVGPGEARVTVGLLGVAALLNGLVDHFGAILRGAERFGPEARMNLVRAAATAAGGVFVVSVGRTLVSLAAATAAASALAFGFGLVLVRRSHPTRGRSGWDRHAMAGALGESLPIWFAGLLSLLYFKLDTVFLRAFAGDAELGAYGAAYKLFEGAMLVPAVVLAVTFPALVRVQAERARRVRLERAIALGLLGAGSALGLAALLLSRPLVDLLFGAAFGRADGSLRVLGAGLPLVFLNFALTHFLLARRRERVNTVLAFMMLLVTVGLDLALIPGRGGPGAALATVIAELALTGGALWALARRA
jgi:O-antigen/teichoic acid export membrane protein